MKVVILAGGYGTRFFEESKYKPKPMIEIGDMPILWHIMKGYSQYGFHDFIICAGYKQQFIKEWFSHYYLNASDVKFSYSDHKGSMEILHSDVEPWDVTVCNTGLDTMTGGRILRIQKYIGDEPFMVTYGDGVCDVNLHDLLDFHRSHGKIATITSVLKDQSKGVLDINEYGAVKSFREKHIGDGAPINAGFMVFQPEIFNYLDSDETILETEPMERLAEEGQLMSYCHKGFWQCMDSLREKMILEKLWESGKAPWKTWT